MQKMEMTNKNGLGEGAKTCETDPLQMLAKQCDTISGDEEGGAKGGKGAKPLKGGQQMAEGRGGGPMLAQQKGQSKAKSPNKVGFDPCLPSAAGAVFPNGFLPPHPAQLAALMNPFLGPMSQQRHPQPLPMGPPPPFPPNNFGLPPPNGGGPPPQFGPPPPAAQLNLMQQLMAAVQQQMPPPHLLPPGMFPPPHSGIPLPPSMPVPLRKPDQPNVAAAQAEVEAAALAHAMAMFPAGPNPFPGGNMPPSTPHQNENSAFAQQLLQQPVQALLMAAACGQLPQFPCCYKMPGGAICGRVFPSDDQLFAHFKSAHIAQMSSPSAVSSTTEGPATASTAANAPQSTQTPTTTAAGGGKMKAGGNKNSPSSSRSTPTNGGGQQSQPQMSNGNGQKPHSNPGPMVFNGGWPPHLLPQIGIPPPPPQAFLGGGNAGQHRFHPYLMSGGLQNGQSSKAGAIHVPPSQNLQQMAMALNLMANGGLHPMAGAPPDLGVHPPSQSLAALAAMANSIGGANQPTGQSANSNASASVGAGSG